MSRVSVNVSVFEVLQTEIDSSVIVYVQKDMCTDIKWRLSHYKHQYSKKHTNTSLLK